MIPKLFLWLGIPLGLIFTFLSPPFQVPDEIYHFYRAYAVSTGSCIPPTDRAVPASFNAAHIKLASVHWGSQLSDYPRFLAQLWSESKTAGTVQLEPNLYNSLYTCFPYLVSATGVGAAKTVSDSMFTLMYAARLANLTVYLLLTYLALQIIPICRTALFALALLPMSLQQAASVSADAITIASAFLYCAYVLYLAYDERLVKLTDKQLALLGALLLFASLCKLNLPFVLLPLLIPAVRFGSMRKKLATVAIAFVLVLTATVAWQWLDRANVKNFEAARVLRGIDSRQNIRFIAEHPMEFAAALDRTVRATAREYALEFVGRLGLLTIPLPMPIVWGYILVLLALALAGSGTARVTLPDRLLAAVIFVGSILSVFILIWSLETTQAVIADQMLRDHNGWVLGFQGRYLIPMAPVLFLAISGSWPWLSGRYGVWLASAMTLAGAASAAAAVCSYYTRPVPAVVTSPAPVGKVSRPGIYRKGVWLWEESTGLKTMTPGGQPQDLPVVGDWNGTGVENIGIYRNGLWVLDTNGDGQFTGEDRSFSFGGLPEDVPVPGDWTGDGHTKAGIYRKGAWLLDLNGDGRFDEQTDKVLHFGGLPGDIPVVGDWTGDKHDKIGIFRQGFFWMLDINGNGVLDAGDQSFAFGGIPGDLPLVGDWTGSGTAKIGIFRQGYFWILDANGNHRVDVSAPGQDSMFPLGGMAGDKPVVRKWQ